MRRLVVDWEQCDGHGLCAALAPELVDLDEWGYPVVEAGVSPDLVSRARSAVRACPALALHLTRERGSQGR